MIKTMFSKRHKCKVYRLDAKVNGKRFRRFFFKKSEAEAVAYKIKHDEVARRYGLPVMAERPFLSDLIEKRLAMISGPEHTRAEKPGHLFEEWDRIETPLGIDALVTYQDQQFRCYAGRVVWKHKRWWMLRQARRV